MNQIRIVLADDHPTFRQTLRLLIERQADLTIVAEAADGVAAIEMVEQHRPDVVLIDVRLPRLDGLEATRHITSKFPQTKVIVLTLFTDDGTRVAAMEAGASFYLPKEGNFAAMLAVIRSCIPPSLSAA